MIPPLAALLRLPLAVAPPTPPDELTGGAVVALLVILALGGAFGWLVLRKVWSNRSTELEVPPPRAQEKEKKTRAPRLRPVPTAKAEPEETSATETVPEAATMADGLRKTRREGFMGRLRRLLSKELEPGILDQMEEILLTADIGVETADKLLARVRQRMSRKELAHSEAVLQALREEVEEILRALPLPEPTEARPEVILVIGVNGTGKTTTLGKLAALRREEGRKVLLVAGDTYRAAAVDQLEVWARRAGVDFHRGREGADPASVVFDGITRARDEGHDLVLCDTAGRLHTSTNLLEELKKVVRVAGKALAGAPHEVILVLDATIGQNAVLQARTFTDAIGVSGLILTKLDGTARGGVVLGIADQLQIPIHFVGVGEKIHDLRPFLPSEFVDGLFASEP